MLFWQTLEVLSKQPTFLGTVTGANGGGGDGTRILVVCEDGLLINDLRSSIFGGGGGPGGMQILSFSENLELLKAEETMFLAYTCDNVRGRGGGGGGLDFGYGIVALLMG